MVAGPLSQVPDAEIDVLAAHLDLLSSQGRAAVRQEVSRRLRTMRGDHVTAAADVEDRRACPDCGTLVDEDGYCVDVGCRSCGKAVPL